LKRNNYCLYNLGVYIIIAIRIIMIIVILSKVAKHKLHSPLTARLATVMIVPTVFTIKFADFKMYFI
jgi:hypothetical protein